MSFEWFRKTPETPKTLFFSFSFIDQHPIHFVKKGVVDPPNAWIIQSSRFAINQASNLCNNNNF